MTISWGWKIALVYVGFAAMIICLVVASSHQKIDLVSKDYYRDEIAYQGVIDASKNQSNLAGSLSIHANANEIIIEFPDDFNNKQLTGNVNLYSAANQDWDKDFVINATGNKMTVPRTQLHKTLYTLKVAYAVDGKNFYYETQIDLHAS